MGNSLLTKAEKAIEVAYRSAKEREALTSRYFDTKEKTVARYAEKADEFQRRSRQIYEELGLINLDIEMDDIEVEFTPLFVASDGDVEQSRQAAISAVLAYGKTVSIEDGTATYRRGNRKVDLDKFEGYALAHPEVEGMMSRGEPSVTLKLKI